MTPPPPFARAAARAAATGALALAVAGCALFGGDEPPPPCPDVSVLGEAARLTRFADGAGRDLIDVDFEAEMTDVRFGCERDVDDATGRALAIVALAPVVTAQRGPANRDREARFDYFVGVVDPAGQVLNKQTFGLRVQFPGNRTRVLFSDDDPPVSIDIPLGEGRAVREFRVLVGFQLTPDELEMNRRRDAVR